MEKNGLIQATDLQHNLQQTCAITVPRAVYRMSGGQAQLAVLALQPIPSRYQIYCLPQDRINIRVHFVGQI
jgi:hypothetical protein